MLGCYDSFKKQALKANAVIPVLFLNTLFSSLIFLPFIILSATTDTLQGTIFQTASGGWEMHKYIVLKALIVLSSWILGYFGMKHLPLTIVGPINATRPVMVLVGALLFFGERLNVWQWIGVLLAVASFLMLSRSGKKEGIDFKHDHWIYMIVGAAMLGAISGLYARPYDGTVVVQYLPVWDDGLDVVVALVAEASGDDAFPLVVVNPWREYLPLHCRLHVFLFPLVARCDDLYCVNDPSWQCHREFPLRRLVLPGEEPQG